MRSLLAYGISFRFFGPKAAFRFGPGLLLVMGLAGAALLFSQGAWASRAGLSPLTLAILLGMALGNALPLRTIGLTSAGAEFAKSTLLRAGIVLYGLRVSFQDVACVGWSGFAIAVVMVTLTFVVAVSLGKHIFKLDRETSMLIGAGSAICGAAAVLATEPIVQAKSHKVAVAVATVMVFGTLSMFLYPVLFPYLRLSVHAYGIYAGSTIHEVAQVVVAARSVGKDAADAAVIEKMLRVMLLAPFLLMLGRTVRTGKEQTGPAPSISFPWFAVFFVIAIGLHSLRVLAPALVDILVSIDTTLLAFAMAALGFSTRIRAIRQAGLRPLLLASTLFLFLTVAGYVVNVFLLRLFS